MGANVDNGGIHAYLQGLSTPGYRNAQTLEFEYENVPRWAPPVTPDHPQYHGTDVQQQYSDAGYQQQYDDADYRQQYGEYGGAHYQQQYDDDAQSESTTTSTMQTYTTRPIAPSSVSSAPPATPPGRPPRTFVEQFQGLDINSPPTRLDQILWCEFSGLLDCPATFSLADGAGWIQHHVGHLRDRFPQQLMCWYCDHVLFVAQHPREEYANFLERMEHVRGHITSDHRLSPGTGRPDFFVVKHLRKLGLLSERRYNRAMAYNETPHAYRLPESHSHSHSHHQASSSSSSSRGPSGSSKRDRAQYHDLDKEKRERRKREKAAAAGRGR